jgi:hypothetical protein
MDADLGLCECHAYRWGDGRTERAPPVMGVTFRDSRTPTLAEFREAVDEYGSAAICFTAL